MITIVANDFGLRQKDMDFMKQLFTAIPEIETVILYGSRATGKYDAGSDVDLALCGDHLTQKQVSYVHQQLEYESPALLWFDVVGLNSVNNAALKEQIERTGKVIFSSGVLRK